MKLSPFPRVIVLDANFLVCVISTKKPGDDEHRARYLLACAEKAHAQVIIPMPALAEYLVRADTASLPFLDQMERKAYIRMAPFDRAAAFECAQMGAAALGRADKRDGLKDSWQKVKVDRQIVAIAKVVGATLIVSSDEGVRTHAMRVGLHAMTIQELPFPEDMLQGKLPLLKGQLAGPLPTTGRGKVTPIRRAQKTPTK